jgi:hypothetical protein
VPMKSPRSVASCGDDAQTFIDVIDEVRSIFAHRGPVWLDFEFDAFVGLGTGQPDLSPRIRKKCLRSLYRMCGRHALLPRALKIPVCYDRTATRCTGVGLRTCGRGAHDGRDVAVKGFEDILKQ